MLKEQLSSSFCLLSIEIKHLNSKKQAIHLWGDPAFGHREIASIRC
jgi:hypothetical protein